MDIAIPSPMNTPRKNIGIAQSICQEKGAPIIDLITKNTSKVGINLKTAIMDAEIGSIIRGNAVFIIKR
jgi:hypothetical protein